MSMLSKYFNRFGSGCVVKAGYYQDNVFYTKTIVEGLSCIYPEEKRMNEESYFDIASLTKFYTAIAIHKTVEKGKLSLEDTISNIDSRFLYLEDVTILDLLSHRLELWTNGYLGNAKSKEEFYQMLFEAKIKSKEHKYTDSHYMILGIVLEKIYQLSYADIIKQEILEPLSLNHTTFEPELLTDIVSSGYMEENQFIDHYPHDTKAYIAYKLGFAVGHAGIFTTATDLFTLLTSILDGKERLLKSDTIKQMLAHDDYEGYIKQYQEIHGNLEDCIKPYNSCGTRYPYNQMAHIPFPVGENTIIFSGYTGPIFLIDFTNRIIVLVMVNVCHMTGEERKDRLNATISMVEEVYKTIKKD